MAKRIIIISSGPIFIALALIVLVFISIGHGQQVTLESAQAQVFSFIETNKWNEADAVVDKILNEYAGDPALPSTLSDIADTYCWHRKYDGAERMYRFIIDKSFDSAWTTKARLNMTRLEILKQIEEKKFWEAEAQLNDMVKDFRDEPNLPVAIFHIGQEFVWQRGYGEAKTAFDYIVNDFSNMPLGQEAKLWLARAKICCLITNRPVKDNEIGDAIDKLLNDFSGDSRLADTLFWLSREYEWTRGAINNRSQWYNAPNSVYERLMSQFKYGQAEWDYKRLNHRMKIFNLMKGPDQNTVDAAIEEMVADLNGRTEVAGELYWIACGYEEQPDKCSKAKEMFERIVKEYPDSQEADRAVLEVQRRIITDMIIEGDMDGAEVLMDKFVADFKQHPYSGNCLGRVAMGYYKKGVELKEQKKLDEAKEHFERGANVWRRVKENNLLTMRKDDVILYFYAANIYLSGIGQVGRSNYILSGDSRRLA